jgi:ABC-2 type transport system permease protein
MKKLLQSKYGWFYVLLLLVAVNYIAGLVHFRIDLTQEKRFTLSKPTNNLLKSLQAPVNITVLLDGDIPAGFKKLAGSASDMLSEFKEIAGSKINFSFEKAAAGVTDSLKMYVYDSLQQLGINPTNVKAQAKEGEGMEERFVFPGAVIRYKDRTIGVDFLQGQSNTDGINSLNNAEALLEYKLAGSIRKITRDSVPVIGYLTGNGEPVSYHVYDLIDKTIRPDYGFSPIPIDSVNTIPAIFDALFIVKPVQRFTDAQKLKIDQYIMNGGKVIWMLDNLYASLDSLQRSEGRFVAFDMGLNLEDQLFKYGVRINQDLVQDLQCDQIPSVIGSYGNKPQMQVLPWPYFPLLRNTGGHPISKNLDYVLSQFPQSIDTVKADGIKKTVLLSTSAEARTLNAPAIVEWASIKNEDDLKTFSKSNIPVAVLLEGKFSSLFANRISSATADTLARIYRQPFKPAGDADNKMIVVSDGDIALNPFSQKGGPMTMGMNQYTRYQYANKEFLLNAIEYLVDSTGILESRGKDYVLRLLDKKKVEEDKTFWQLVNTALPVLLIIIIIGIYQYMRKRKYQSV